MARKPPKTVVAFKVEKELADLLNKLPNKSAFIRKAIAAQLGMACPLCNGKGVVPRGVHDHFAPLLEQLNPRQCDGCGDELPLPLDAGDLDDEDRARLEQFFLGGPLYCDGCYDKAPTCDDCGWHIAARMRRRAPPQGPPRLTPLARPTSRRDLRRAAAAPRRATRCAPRGQPGPRLAAAPPRHPARPADRPHRLAAPRWKRCCASRRRKTGQRLRRGPGRVRRPRSPPTPSASTTRASSPSFPARRPSCPSWATCSAPAPTSSPASGWRRPGRRRSSWSCSTGSASSSAMPPATQGILTGGGSEANLTALVAARERLA